MIWLITIINITRLTSNTNWLVSENKILLEWIKTPRLVCHNKRKGAFYIDFVFKFRDFF